MQDSIRRFKEKARNRLRPTWQNLVRPEFGVVPRLETEGEAANLIDFPAEDRMFAFTNDGVGTKTVIALAMSRLRPAKRRFYWRNIGCDAIAANVNDLAAVGATPLWILDDIQIGLRECLEDPEIVDGILDGFIEMCRDERIAITGGETALMRDVVAQDKMTISVSAIGIVQPRSHAILRDNLREGDIILGFPAPSLQTNGFTLARDIAAQLPEGYLTRISAAGRERVLGEVLLRRSVTYTREMMALLDAGVPIHYASHISGGGWQKIRRAPQEFTYEIANVPNPPEIFRFLQEAGNISDEEAYRTWNMGVGFVIFVRPSDVAEALNILRLIKSKVIELGYVRRGPRQVMFANRGYIL
jgi:phosphoribosylformylglycinamidine cyclo-ligase